MPDLVKVVGTYTPDELIEKIENERPDLVVLDIKMVDYNGLDLLQDIRNKFYDMPVILCTGYSSVIGEESAAVQGISHFLMKPLTMRVLTETVRKALDREGAR